MKPDKIKSRLEYLRGEIQAERISYGEIAELQGLAAHIEPGDMLLFGVGRRPGRQITNLTTTKTMKTQETRARVERQRKAHHAALEALALTVGCKADGLSLWRKLARLERKVYPVCADYTNGDNGVGVAKWEGVKASARTELAAIFAGKIPKGVFINGDPRGHMLKLDNDEVTIPEGMEKDWGGNGILAAEIEGES